MNYWLLSDKGDPDMIRLVDGKIDGEIHYSRQTPGSRLCTRNGQNIVLIGYNNGRPVMTWVSFRPTPGKATRADKRDAAECALFKLIRGHGLRKPSGGALRASHLIQEATRLTRLMWGDYRDGMITFIKPDATTARRSDDHAAGWSYRRAGWVEDRPSGDGKLCLRAPLLPVSPADIYGWRWSGSRGGKMREEFEKRGVFLGAKTGPDPSGLLAQFRARGTCVGCDNPGSFGSCDLCGSEVK